MPASDRELVAAIRSELAAIEPARSCDRLAELTGLGGRRPREASVARLVARLRRGARAAAGDVLDVDWATAPDHCRVAWLRGIFLATGSLSVANGRTHLEFVTSPTDGRTLVDRLDEMGLPAGLRERRGRGVATWKSSETIGRFLRLAGSSAAVLELESRSVSRSLRGELNRVVNAEAANLARSVTASGRHIAAIDDLEARGILSGEPRGVRAVAQARRDAPEASLSDLSERTGLHRSAVQRALDRIARIAHHEEAGPRQRRDPRTLAS
ncbi:MAG TPA: DNA-binding protein WhiA [Candidatus Limnocylindrales bacterium]|nr:DNA-binding protein WhiA [Candidatus Limnocylindrales bacterium]